MAGQGAEMEDLKKKLSALEEERDYYRQVAERLGRKTLADAQDFSHMIRDLRQREIHLQQSQEHLEKTIEERTAELIARNKELSESTLRYDRLVKRIPHGVYTFGVKSNGARQFLYVSPPFCQILDIDPEELQRNALLAFSIVYPDDRAGLESATREANEHGSPFRWSGRFIVRGKIRWIRLEADPTITPEGDIVWHGVLSDITEQRLNQDKLQESQERLNFLIKNSSDALVIINSDGSLRFVSQAGERITGFARAELEGRTFDTFIHPDDTAAVKAAWREVVEYPEKSVTIQYRHIHKTQGWVFLETVGQSFLNETAINGVIASVRDMSERIRAEEELEKSAAQYSYLFNTMPNGYYLSSHEGYFVEANHAFVRMLGYDSLDDLKSVYIPTDMYVSEAERVGLYTNSEFTDQTEMYRLKRKDGRIIWVEDNARYIKNSEGTILYHQGICKDITDRKNDEEIRSVLLEISNAANTTPDLEDLYVSIHKILGRIIDLTNFYISLYDRKEDVLTFVYWVDTIDHPPKNFQIDNISSPQTQSHTAEVIMTGKPVLHSKEQFMEILRQRGVQPKFSISETWLGVPLKIKGEVIGAMAAHSFIKSNFYSQRDIELFVAVSEQVAIAIERKRADERLQKSESRFRRLIQDIPGIAIQGYRLDGTTTYWNQASERLYGYTEREAIGRNLMELIIPPEMHKEVAASMVQMTRTGQAIPSAELSLMKKDGSRVAVYSNHALVNLPDTPTDLFCLDIDITDRKKVEADKTRLLLCQRAILDNLPMMAWLKDTEGCIEMINQPYADACERTVDECLGKTALDLFPEEMAKGFMADDREVIDSGRKKQVEEKISTPDGDKWHLTYKTPIYDEHRVVIGTTGIAQDITERKRAEEERERLQMQLNQAQKMEAVGQLAGGVAHDFNNMLGVIVGYSEMILEEGGTSQEFYAELEEIQKAARRSADLTRQLLAFARKQTVAPKVLDLNQTIEGMLNMLRRLIGENIHLAWMPGNGLWPIKIDPSQIDQILANLCVNARDAISGVGTITVATDNCSFSEEYIATHAGPISGDFVLMSVSDTGNGMSKETLAHIFEPFFTTKGVGEGTGLGLASVYGAVKQNNGFLNVLSEPGQGATFTIYIPRYTEKDKPLERPVTEESIPCGTETILLVEDEPMMLEMTTHMLGGQGYHVLMAASPLEAIHLAKEYPGSIDLLMTDVIMPEMNGRDLAKQLLSFLPNLKNLFMSGYTTSVLESHGILDEGIHFIEKPFMKRDLALAVRKAIER